MKDMLNRDITVGCYIAYGLVVGRSANLAIYHVREVLGDKIKAHKLDASYEYGNKVHPVLNIPNKYCVFEYDPNVVGSGYHRPMTDKEREKVDNKLATLTMGERALVIDPSTVDFLKAM